MRRPRPIALAAALVCMALGAQGCGKVKVWLGRGGADLAQPLVANTEFTYRVLVESLAPVWTAGAPSSSTARMDLKIRFKTTGKEADGFVPADLELLEGRWEVDARPRTLPTIGRTFPFKLGSLRRVTRPQGIMHPTGLELLEIAPPNGRVKPGEEWKSASRRMLILPQEEIDLDKFYRLADEGTQAGEPAWHLIMRVEPFKRSLASGAQLDLSGTGEVWIARKDGRILKATEILDGQWRDEKLSREAGRFAQAVTLLEAASAPADLPQLLQAAPAAAAAAPRPPGVPAPATPQPPTTAPPAAAPATAAPPPPVPAPMNAASPATRPAPGTPAVASASAALLERIVFVSHATGKREVWSVAPDGTGKRALSGFAWEHWSPSLDQDGRILACASRRATGVNLWTLNLATGDATALTSFGERDEIESAWAFGGQRLVLLKAGKIWVIHPDGFNLQSLAVGARATAFAATPKSSRIAVVVTELNQYRIVTVDVVSGAVHNLLEGDQPSWSPDGARLAYRSGDSLGVVNADGTNPRLILKGPFAETPLLWTPNGQKIILTKVDPAGENVIAAGDQPGQTPTRVTANGGTALAVSPAGDRVVYSLHGDLWTATMDAATHAPLTADGMSEGPVWWGKHYVP